MVALGVPSEAYSDGMSALIDLMKTNQNDGWFSDFSITTFSNARSPTNTFYFTNAFPINLSSVRMTSADLSSDPILATVTFAYERYNWERTSTIPDTK